MREGGREGGSLGKVSYIVLQSSLTFSVARPVMVSILLEKEQAQLII